MAVIRWNDPFRELAALQDRMNRVFDEHARARRPERGGALHRDLGARPSTSRDEGQDRSSRPSCPASTRSQIHLRFEDGVLTLEGERKFEKESGDENYHRVERSYGKFVRSFTIPSNVDDEQHLGGVRQRRPHRRAAEARGDEAEADPDQRRLKPALDVKKKRLGGGPRWPSRPPATSSSLKRSVEM